jgi:methyl-accepting chemotaxis protein
MAFGSGALFDSHFNIAHFLKIVAYLVPFAGLSLEYIRTYETVRGAVGRLSSTAADLLAGASQQASGAREQAAAVSQTVTAVEQIAQTASQAAQRAGRLGEAVRRALEVGRTGRTTVENSIAALNQLKERIESTAGDILALAEHAQAIGAIIAAVDDIAEQTHLLALNAAIEAARAGEQGRGFAVVAGEVKELADQSKKATAQVRQILGEIQRATSTAVLSTEEVTKGVAAAIQVGDQSGATIVTLADTLTDAAQATSQIVASAGQQATGMTQISQAMQDFDRVAQQNLAATRHVEQAARELNALGTRLAGLTEE